MLHVRKYPASAARARAAVMLLAGFGAALAARAETYFLENFRNYTDRAPGTAVGWVANDAVWANEATLNARSARETFIFEQFKPEQVAADFALSTYDLAFRFSINGKDSPPPFSVVIRAADGQDAVITVSRTNVTVSGAAGDAKAELDDLKGDRCYFHLKVKNNRADLHLTANRVFKKVLSFGLPKLRSFNLKLAPNADLSLSDIALTSPVPLLDFSARRLYADFRSLRDDAGLQGAVPVRKVELTGNGDGIRFRHGHPESPVTMTLFWNDGSQEIHAFTLNGEDGISLGKLASVRTRPEMRRFECPQYKVPASFDLRREWDDLPKASELPLDVDFQRQPGGIVSLFFDGHFSASLIKKIETRDPADKKRVIDTQYVALKSIAFDFPTPTPVRIKKPQAAVDRDRFLALDIGVNPRAKAFVDAKSSLQAGLHDFNGVPVVVVDPVSSSDVGICRQGVGNWALEVEEYHGRAANEGFPCEIHYALPVAPYSKAWIVCAIDPDKTKDPVLVTRFGRYVFNGSGGNMIADTIFEMPADGTIPPNLKPVGTVRHKGADVPLYLLELPLNLGTRLDLSNSGDKISFEFVGKLGENVEQLDNSMKPDPGSTSAFQIFGVTLEMADVSMDIRERQPGNVFTADEKAETTVVLNARVDGAKGAVSWVARDVDGREVFKGERRYSVAKRGEAEAVVIPLKAGVGYYDLDITLRDRQGGAQLAHPARFAILPRDERRATIAESPFATWWFGYNHGSTGDPKLGGPLLRKAGIRKSGWMGLKGEDSRNYKAGASGQVMLPLNEWAKIDDQFNFPETDVAKAVRSISSTLTNDPNTTFLVWHESAPGYGIPEELLGLPVPTSDETMAKRTARVGRFIRAVGQFRDKHFPRSQYPGMKIQIGNSNTSIGAATLPFRGGAKASDIDYIGIECAAQVIAPEKLSEIGLQGQMISKDIATLLAGQDAKLNGTWEFTYRCERDMGEQQQAEWYMRDLLICLAHEYIYISPGLLIDCTSGYYNGLWGAAGIITRMPYLYPKRAYVAYAALTSVLDAVKLRRQVPTGSTTVYAFEYARRHDKQLATALWAARGAADFEITFERRAHVRVFDMYGRESKASGRTVTVHAGEAPAYILTDRAITGITLKNRTFPKDMRKAAKASVGSPFDRIGLIDPVLIPDPIVETKSTAYLPVMKPSGAFRVSQTNDPVQGEAIAVSLDSGKNAAVGKYVTEYTTLRLKEPAPIPGNPAAVGIWVKGNSNWGQIRFEIEDAEGEVFKSLSTSGWGCDVLDWPGNLCVNFDGWTIVSHPLRPTRLFNDHSPGPVSEQWVSGGGDKTIDLPVKIRAVTVGMNRQKLDITDFKPAVPVILLKNVCGLDE